MGRVYRVTIVVEGIDNVFLIRAESFDAAYRHVREEHALEIISKIEEIVSVRDL